MHCPKSVFVESIAGRINGVGVGRSMGVRRSSGRHHEKRTAAMEERLGILLRHANRRSSARETPGRWPGVSKNIG